MKCPFCNASDTKVIDSRPADDNSSIRRRRQCEQCGRRFTTYEKLETMPLMVIKKDDSRETYDRSKLEKGILLSCHKRPVSFPGDQHHDRRHRKPDLQYGGAGRSRRL